MKQNIDKIIKELSNSFMRAFQACLASNVGINPKANKNTLQNSDMSKTVQSKYQDKDGDAVVELMVNDYIEFIESGRKPNSKFPPVEPILKWCRKNGIPTDNNTVFLIRRAIARDGIMARPIMKYVWNDIDAQMDKLYFDRIFEEIINDLNIYFNGK